jgi:hypothetical protein
VDIWLGLDFRRLWRDLQVSLLLGVAERPPAKSRDLPATQPPPSCSFIGHRMTRHR